MAERLILPGSWTCRFAMIQQRWRRRARRLFPNLTLAYLHPYLKDRQMFSVPGLKLACHSISFIPPVSFHNRDLLLRQSIQLIDQRVYLPVGGLDPPLQRRLLVRRADEGELLMQG